MVRRNFWHLLALTYFVHLLLSFNIENNICELEIVLPFVTKPPFGFFANQLPPLEQWRGDHL
jgi:hypothetical protein